MTVRQIIQEIEALSPEDRKEVGAYLMGEPCEPLRESSPRDVRFLDRESARPMIAEMLATHSELFRKLAE